METLPNTLNNGKTPHKSHLPIPDENQKAAKQTKKEKEPKGNTKNGKAGQKLATDDTQRTGRGRLSSKEKEPPRPLTKQGSKKELLDENCRLKEEIHRQNERIKQGEMALKLELENMERIKLEAENKENAQQDNLDKMMHKCELAETKLSEYKNRVLQSNVDPVMLSQIGVTEEDVDNKFQKQTRAKEEVTTFRANMTRFRNMAEEQQSYLQSMEKKLQEITGEDG